MKKTRKSTAAQASQAARLERTAILRELADDENLSREATEEEIERKYDNKQAQIFIQRNDFLVPNLLEMVKNRELLNLSPTYQRRSRWNDTKRSHLIESLLMNVPIPPIFLYERDLAKYEVMDGQQRVTTLKLFFSNQFRLRRLKRWPELNGRQFDELPLRIQAGLMRRGISAVIILTESSQNAEDAMELRQYVFERLNTGGERLNAQEVRNCIYAGNFNDTLTRIARSPVFTQTWGIPPKESDEPQHISRKLGRNRLYAKMADCEIVLRYFALNDLSQFRGGMKRTLDRYMAKMTHASERQCKALEKSYLEAIQSSHKIFGDSLFRLPKRDGDAELSGRRSVPLADAILLALPTQKAAIDRLIRRRERALIGLKKLLSDRKSYEKLVGRGNTKTAVAERIEIVEKLYQDAVKR